MIVVFDANCLLCSGSVQFLLRHDNYRRLRFATIQSDAGRDLMERAGIDVVEPDSFILVDGQRIWIETGAVLRVVHALGWPWRLAWIAWLIPYPLRDAVYRGIARNRYRWFGRRDVCFLPNPEDADRFIR